MQRYNSLVDYIKANESKPEVLDVDDDQSILEQKNPEYSKSMVSKKPAFEYSNNYSIHHQLRS